MPKLNIPYRSQWADDAKEHGSDCGPTCLAMILNYHGVSITPDRMYDHAHLRSKKSDDFTSFGDLMLVAKAYHLKSPYCVYPNRADAFHNLRANIDAGKPMLALVNYAPWKAPTGNQYASGHFVVVTGYDDANVYIHDPLFGLWVKPGSKGAHYAMSHDMFAAGWGGFDPHDNPNFACITVFKASAAAPAPKPKPTPPPKPKPKVTPPQTAVSTPLTDDIARRIRALAAYRWTEGPDFANTADVKRWQDHLGDFGASHERYVVQSGNTLSALAGRFYDGQHRWPVIKAFNNMKREGLWLGETLMIPHVGQSGAGTDPALPSDTLDKAKALSFDDLVNPDASAQDYSALGSKSVGIGFYEES